MWVEAIPCLRTLDAIFSKQNYIKECRQLHNYVIDRFIHVAIVNRIKIKPFINKIKYPTFMFNFEHNVIK